MIGTAQLEKNWDTDYTWLNYMGALKFVEWCYARVLRACALLSLKRRFHQQANRIVIITSPCQSACQSNQRTTNQTFKPWYCYTQSCTKMLFINSISLRTSIIAIVLKVISNQCKCLLENEVWCFTERDENEKQETVEHKWFAMINGLWKKSVVCRNMYRNICNTFDM